MDGTVEIAPEELAGWVPIRLFGHGLDVQVEWCFLTPRKFAEPFFEQTIEVCLRQPFNQVFLRRTPIEALGKLHEVQPGIPPSGFIFHMSRCGSTLISQLLATLPDTVVISEADPIHWILRSQAGDPAVSEAVRQKWLRWMFTALAQRWSGNERRFFVKFDSWSIVDLPLIHSVFPGVPWVFVYRNPVEVIVSHIRRRGSHVIPSAYGIGLLSLEPAAAARIASEEYCARVLAKICQTAVSRFTIGNAALIEFNELPGAVWSRVVDFFGAGCSERDRERMRSQAQFDAKAPSIRFVGDTGEKNREASPLIRRMAEEWVMPVYRQLEDLRLAGVGLGADGRADSAL